MGSITVGRMNAVPDYREVNAASWDEMVGFHLTSEFYDVAGFKRHRDSLRAFERDEVGTVDGKSLVHLQCHFGQDTLSWAGHGASVTGVDFSAPAIAAARELAAELGIAARFVTAELYESVAALSGATFDVVYTGIGALTWLPDLDRWAETVAALLKPGGFVYLAEFHPITHALDDGTGRQVTKDYFQPEPNVWDEPGSYAAYDAPTVHNLTVQFQHPLGRVVTALARAGLRIEFLHEHDFSLFQQFEGLRRDPDGGFRYDGEGRLPLLYSIKARR